MIIIPMEESPLLVTVDGVIRGVEVEDQVLGRLGVSGDKLINHDLGARDQRRAVNAVFEAAEGWGRGEGPLGIGAPSGGHLQHGVGAEGLMVVEILVAQSESEDPLGEQRLLVVDGEDGMAWVGDHRVEGVEEADAVGDLAQEQRRRRWSSVPLGSRRQRSWTRGWKSGAVRGYSLS